MSEAVKTLMAALMELPEPERLAVADALYASVVPPGVWSEDDPGFDAELERRRVEHESGRAPGIPADEFFRQLRERRK